MAIETLLEFATDRHETAKTAKTNAQQKLAETETKLTKAKEDNAKAGGEFAALEKEVAAIRAALAKIPTRADGDALVHEFEKKLIALRAKQAQILELEETLADLEIRRSQDSAALVQAANAVSQAETAKAAAEKASGRRKTLKDALGTAPLSTLKDDAKDAVQTQPKNKSFLDAEKRLQDDIASSKLFERANARRGDAAKRIDEPEKLFEVAEGLSAKKLGAAFQRAEASLEDYVARAKEQFDRALALLVRVADTTTDALTKEQKAKIIDAALVAKAEAAAEKEEARDKAAASVRDTKTGLEKAILKAKAAAIDADPEDQQAVKDAKKAHEEAVETFKTADDAYTPEMRADLDLWEAAVPDSTWRLFDDFAEAEAELTQLAADPATLIDKLKEAEKAWVEALQAADKAARAAEYVETKKAAYAAEIAFETKVASRRKFSALRGD